MGHDITGAREYPRRRAVGILILQILIGILFAIVLAQAFALVRIRKVVVLIGDAFVAQNLVNIRQQELNKITQEALEELMNERNSVQQ